MVIQFTGLSGAGKSTLAEKIKPLLETRGMKVEVVDGDVYRKTICSDLGFSKEDRCENIRRLGQVAFSFSQEGCVAIIAAINPFESVRLELTTKYNAKTVWIKCGIDILKQRDTKGLYKRALLPDQHPEKVFNLTGINDVFEEPGCPHLVINTGEQNEEESAD